MRNKLCIYVQKFRNNNEHESFCILIKLISIVPMQVHITTICEVTHARVWNSKFRRRSLITDQNLIDSLMCDSHLTLNSVSCSETVLYYGTHAHIFSYICVHSRDKSEILFQILFPISLLEIYQESFWYPGVANLHAIRFYAQLILPWINTEITFCTVHSFVFACVFLLRTNIRDTVNIHRIVGRSELLKKNLIDPKNVHFFFFLNM